MNEISKEQMDEDLKNQVQAYPVGEKSFELFKNNNRIDGYVDVLGVRLYRIKLTSKVSNTEIIFYIYKHPILRKDFTDLGLIDTDENA